MELGERLEHFDLPHCIAINSPGAGAGFLGMSYAPFVVQNPNAPIANLRPPKDVESWRMERRLEMLGQVENQFASQRRAQAAVDHKAVYAKTLADDELSLSRLVSTSIASRPMSATPTAAAHSARVV